MANEPVYLVDGTALIYRAHFAFLRNPLTTSRGEPVGALFGFTSTLLQLIRRERPRWMAVAFDMGEPTFRHRQYAAYKAHRPPMPEELIGQLPLVHRLVDALGLRVLEQSGVEADDLIGTMADLARRQGFPVVIVSADKDFMQLVGEGIRQWIPPSGGGDGEWVDEEAVRTRWGVGPRQMVDLLALMGDASDNVPGVSGVGAKTAAQLLGEYGSLDGIYQHLDALGKKSVRERLERDRENAYLSRDLVRIRSDFPLPYPLTELSVPPLEGREELIAFLREVEFHRLLRGLEGAPVGEETAPATWASETQIIDSEEAFDRFLRSWRDSGDPLVLDTETTSKDGRTAILVGISLAFRPGSAVYVPVGHREGKNLPPGSVRDRLQPILADPEVTLVGQNLKYDLHVLRGLGLVAACRLRDTLLASYLLDPEGAHGLDALSQEHLQHSMIPITDLINQGRNQITMDQVGIARVAEYSGEDADVTLRLFHLLVPKLKSQGMEELWRDLECPLISVLMEMEQVGVKVDGDWLRALSVGMEGELARLRDEVRRAAGTEFNINSPAQLAKVLFDSLKLPARKKTKTGHSTDFEVLEELASLHPVPALVLEYRSLSKLKGTYADTLPGLCDPRTGRIHAQFNQTVAATGRLSSSDPNLQNIPVRTPLGREIRKAFVAERGWTLLSADYSQIELRILAHLSGDPGLKEAFASGADVHAATASRIFNIPVALVDSAMRARAKTINFGVIYGMGAQRLARELSISPAEARRFIEAYFAGMPRVRSYMEECLENARKTGYTMTLMGRRRIVRGLTGKDPRLRAQAERVVTNTPIQGSAADLIKRAMVVISRKLSQEGLRARLILQVHDELVLEVPEEEILSVSALVRESMEQAIPLDVPLPVDVGTGPNWALAHR